MASPLPSARCAEPPAEPGVSFFDQLGGKAPDSITGNPAAENEVPGTGLAGRLLHLPEDSGLRLGGLWLVDTNGLISGGAQPGKWSWNSALIIGANFETWQHLGANLPVHPPLLNPPSPITGCWSWQISLDSTVLFTRAKKPGSRIAWR